MNLYPRFRHLLSLSLCMTIASLLRPTLSLGGAQEREPAQLNPVGPSGRRMLASRTFTSSLPPAFTVGAAGLRPCGGS